MSEQHGSEPSEVAAPEAPESPEQSEQPVLPEVSSDDRDEGWGEDPRDGRRDEQWYRRERPPHHE